MKPLTRSEIEEAAEKIYTLIPATPQLTWPQINGFAGCDVFVKHENHNPTGAFKVRGGITFMDWLKTAHPEMSGIVTATRGNHGQSQARAAKASGLNAKIVVPHGNSAEKNDAMRAFGAQLIEHGADFNEAVEKAKQIAHEENLFLVPAFHKALVKGVATYAFELLSHRPDLEAIYVPIGCGSGICGTIMARDALNLKTKIIGVVSTEAQAAKLSFDNKTMIETPTANTFADGMAVRIPVPDAYEIYSKGAERIVAVSDDEIAEAMRILYKTTHNVAEGAGAAGLAALLQEKRITRGKSAAIILSGGNIDAPLFADVLQGNTPQI